MFKNAESVKKNIVKYKNKNNYIVKYINGNNRSKEHKIYNKQDKVTQNEIK